MATRSVPPSASRPRALRRDPQRRVVGGVCAGIAARLGVDPLVLRVAFVAAAAAGGAGVALYGLAWALIPAADEAPGTRRTPTGRAAVETALGGGLLLLSVLLAFREAGLWFSDAIVWPLVLVAAGGALLWRQSLGGPGHADEPAAGATPEAVARRGVAPAVDRDGDSGSDLPARAAVISRTGLGIALVVAAGLAFLQATGSLSAARDVVLAALVVMVVLAVIFAPWIVRLGRSLAAERAARIRSQERAELAAHLHDSVLQTLALVQRRAGRPQEVAALARRQERELRTWLSGRRPMPGEQHLAAALASAAEEVERRHGVEVEVVAVGDAPLDEGGEALVAAAREAIVNAAKFGGGSPVDVYAETDAERLQVFIRDRGPGFDLESVPPDRRGIRESIVGRMSRHGGHAAIGRGPTGGTEVELTLERPRS
jgi:phage shock protein PspC (stress-responsive transcriptional regulator)